jgi:hypothetical protein
MRSSASALAQSLAAASPTIDAQAMADPRSSAVPLQPVRVHQHDEHLVGEAPSLQACRRYPPDRDPSHRLQHTRVSECRKDVHVIALQVPLSCTFTLREGGKIRCLELYSVPSRSCSVSFHVLMMTSKRDRLALRTHRRRWLLGPWPAIVKLIRHASDEACHKNASSQWMDR